MFNQLQKTKIDGVKPPMNKTAQVVWKHIKSRGLVFYVFPSVSWFKFKIKMMSWSRPGRYLNVLNSTPIPRTLIKSWLNLNFEPKTNWPLRLNSMSGRLKSIEINDENKFKKSCSIALNIRMNKWSILLQASLKFLLLPS